MNEMDDLFENSNRPLQPTSGRQLKEIAKLVEDEPDGEEDEP